MSNYCLIVDRIYPFSIDPTAKIAGRFLDALLNNNNSVIAVSKAVQLRKLKVIKKDKINYYLIRNFDIPLTYYKLCLKQKRILLKPLYWFLYFLSKINKKNDEKYCKKVNEVLSGYNFDHLVLMCGNFNLCLLKDKHDFNFKKSSIFATDYWSRFFSDEQLISYNFDNYYVLPSMMGDIKNTKFKNWFLFINNFNNFCNQEKREPRRISYFGNLYAARDSMQFLKILNNIKSDNVYFYCDVKKEIKNSFKNIHFVNFLHDYAFNNEVNKTDIIIILDNNKNYSKWIPSKILNGMATKKPIILFSYSKDSYSWKILSDYPLARFVNMYDENEASAENISNLINSLSMKVSGKSLFDLFPEADCEYFYKENFSK